MDVLFLRRKHNIRVAVSPMPMMIGSEIMAPIMQNSALNANSAKDVINGGFRLFFHYMALLVVGLRC